MTAHVLSATTIGFEGCLIEVECDSANGLPSLQIVGLGNKAIDEAKERVRSAIKNSGLTFPAKRITINLAPANLPKDGAHFDVPIAIAILVVSGQLQPRQIKGKMFAGELGLDGSIRAIRGSINIAEVASKNNIKELYLPIQNKDQAELIDNVEIKSTLSLRDMFLALKGETILATPAAEPNHKHDVIKSSVTFDQIFGQEQAKRALTIAAAGHHNILFDGPPGAGKTMLAKALLSLLPDLQSQEIIDVTKLYSLAGEADDTIITRRPFRSPHHTASYISLVGGGRNPQPGEISLAHHGVLFLDELPEYPRASLESLRQPLEDREVHISRANQRLSFPANFMLVATKNPCPCGFAGDPTRECSCSAHQVVQYQKRISGPLLDRIDMIIPVARVEHRNLLSSNKSSTDMAASAAKAVAAARKTQSTRYGSFSKTNATLSNQDIKERIVINDEAKQLLNAAAERLQLSARGYFKVLKVSQTIADLDGDKNINARHISEALQYRMRT